MTWGFFLYVIWFNPGQSAQYYALLQLYSPVALLTQGLAGAVAQGVGLAGFIWFALRAPTDETTPRWRPVERSLPFIAVLLALCLRELRESPGLSHGDRDAYRCSKRPRCCRVRFRDSPYTSARTATEKDYQRLRWVIWAASSDYQLSSSRTQERRQPFSTFYGPAIPRQNNSGAFFIL